MKTYKSNDIKGITPAKKAALAIPAIIYRFLSYKTEDDYDKGEHYFYKDFLDHTEMKKFSATHSAKEKEFYPDYCSIYYTIKITVQ